MKNKGIVYIGLYLSWSFLLLATPVSEEIKGTYSILHPKYRHLSPLPGMVWATGGILENLSELDDKSNNKSVSLIKNLFKRFDQANFLPSNAAAKAVAHMRPYLLGKLSYHLARVRLHRDSDVKNIKFGSRTKEAMVAKRKFVDGLLHLILADEDLQRSREGFKSETKRQEKELERLIADERDLEQYKKSSHGDAEITHKLQAQIIDIRKKIRRIRALNEGPSFEKKFRMLLSQLVDAAQIHDENISVFKVIGALVFHKSTDKRDYYHYFRGIFEAASSIEIKTKSTPTAIFLDPTVFTSDESRDLFLMSRFSEADEWLGTHDDYELLAFQIMKTRLNWLPPYLTAFEKATLSSKTQIFDCGENSLLNFYRILFADQATASIDLELLASVGKPHRKLLDFFSTKIKKVDGSLLDFSRLADLRSAEARNAWADVTANLNSDGGSINASPLIYCNTTSTEECEIKTGFSNMENFIKRLSGVLTLDALVADFNKAAAWKLCVTKDLDSNLQFGTVTISRGQDTFIWNFQDGHFFLTSTGYQTVPSSFIKFLLKQPQPLVDLVSLVKATSANMKMKMIVDKSFTKQESYISYLTELRTDEDILLFWREIIKKHRVIRDVHFLAGLLGRIQQDDTHLLVQHTLYDHTAHVQENFLAYIASLKMIDRLDILQLKGRDAFELNSLQSLMTYCKCEEENVLPLITLILSHINQETLERQSRLKSTALHTAIARGFSRIALLLLEKMSSEAISLHDSHEKTALDLAVESTSISKEVVDALKAKTSSLGSAL